MKAWWRVNVIRVAVLVSWAMLALTVLYYNIRD